MNYGQDKYRLLIENLPDAFAYHKIITDSAGNPVDYVFMDVNRNFEEMFSLSKDNVIGRNITDVYPNIKESSFDWIGTFGRVAPNGGGNLRFEHYYKPQDRWYEITAYSYEPGFFAVIFRDITESKKSEEAFKLNSGLITSLVDSLPDLVFYKDLNGVYLGCNAEFALHVGYEKEDIVGKTDYDLYSKEEADAFRENDRHMLELGTKRHNEEWISYPDGRKVLLDTLKIPYYNGDGKRIGILGICRDITERKQAEQKLADHTLELEVLYQQLEILLRETHHRVKNNFAVIISMLEMQRRHIGDGEIATILQDLSYRIHAMAMVHEKLCSSKNLSRINMQQYLQTLISHLRVLLQPQSSIEYIIEAQDVELAMDTAVPCALIVQELFTNAVKHAFPPDATPRRTGAGAITVRMEQNKNTYQLEVSDNGVGLSPGLDLSALRTIGMRLVRMLGEHQLGGRVELQGNGQNGGTKCKLQFTVRNS